MLLEINELNFDMAYQYVAKSAGRFAYLDPSMLSRRLIELFRELL